MKPTPGPWQLSSKIPGAVLDAHGGILAHCFQGSSEDTHQQAAADAVLIVAAPELVASLRELLAVAEQVLQWLGVCYDPDQSDRQHAKISIDLLAAITRARQCLSVAVPAD